MKRLALVPLWWLTLSCGSLPPKGQVVVYLDTDAVVPELFDRVRIDVYGPGSDVLCNGCTHVFALDAAVIDEGRLSFGVAEPPNVLGHRIRVRMFRSVATRGGDPIADSTVDVTALLPVVQDEGVVDCTIFLPTDSVAHPIGSLDAPAKVTLGRVVKGHAGTWPGAAKKPCSRAADPGEACIPGGASWMGNPLVQNGQSDIQRLVVSAPFFLDTDEVTVKRFRDEGGLVSSVVPQTKNGGADTRDWCTFTPTTNDAFPLNCVDWATAKKFCEDHDGQLPTEAQFERASSALRGSLYVWGSEEPLCSDATFARAGGGTLYNLFHQCRDPSDIVGGPLPLDRDRSDRVRLVLPAGTIFDLAGSMSEWTLDRWDDQDGACWGRGVFTDPVCDNGSGQRATRGGNWLDFALALRASFRAPYASGVKTISIGFRCARAG